MLDIDKDFTGPARKGDSETACEKDFTITAAQACPVLKFGILTSGRLTDSRIRCVRVRYARFEPFDDGNQFRQLGLPQQVELLVKQFDFQAACSLFWTLGGNQVSKAALAGWNEVVRPAVLRGGALWPFDGELAELAGSTGLVLAETYPAEAYRMVGAGFLAGESKRRQVDRRAKADAVLGWACRHGVVFSGLAATGLANGFGSTSSGEDQFDALLGLLKMIEVVEGRRPERTERHETTADWEGWILGR